MMPEHNILQRREGGRGRKGKARGGARERGGDERERERERARERWGVAVDVCVMDMVNKDACIHLSSPTRSLLALSRDLKIPLG